MPFKARLSIVSSFYGVALTSQMTLPQRVIQSVASLRPFIHLQKNLGKKINKLHCQSNAHGSYFIEVKLKNYKIKKVETKMFLKKSVVRDLSLYDSFCRISFQLNWEEVRKIPKEYTESMIFHRPVIVTLNKNGWEIIGGFKSLLLAQEISVNELFIVEVNQLTTSQYEMLVASEYMELLLYQLHRKTGYANLLDSVKKLSQSGDVGKYLSGICSTRKLSRFTGVSRDAIRYQNKFLD